MNFHSIAYDILARVLAIERSFDIREPLYAVSFGPISTPTVLGSREQMDRVARAFPGREPHSATEFYDLSCGFTHASGLMTPGVERVLTACRAEGIPASMTMLGDGVFTMGSRAHAVLRPFGPVYTCTMAQNGPRVLEVLP